MGRPMMSCRESIDMYLKIAVSGEFAYDRPLRCG